MIDSIRLALEDLADSHIFDNATMRILLILLAAFTLQAISHRFINVTIERVVRNHKHASRLEEHKREATLKTFFRTAISIFIWLVSAALIFVQFPINLAPLFASASIIAIVVGIGGQTFIKDSLAGVFIILENQLRIEDIVTIATPAATVSGMVEDVSLRATRLRDIDGNLHILSNGQIGVITNRSYRYSMVDIDVHITYDTDLDLAEKLIDQAGQAAAKDKQLKDSILEPVRMLRIEDLGDATVTLKALGKVKPGGQWEVASHFRRHLKALFDEHHIKPPNQAPLAVAAEPEPQKKK